MPSNRRLIPFLLLTTLSLLLLIGMLFSVQGQMGLPRADLTNIPVTLPAPGGFSTTSDVQFRFSRLPDQNGGDPGFGYKYKLSITDSKTGQIRTYTIDPATCAGDCIVSPQSLDPFWTVTDDRQYTWKVVAKLNGGGGKFAQSDKRAYVVDVWDTIPLVLPAARAQHYFIGNAATLEFRWTDVGAESYRLLIRQAADSVVHSDSGYVTDSVLCSAGTCSSFVDFVLSGPTYYQWQVFGASARVTGKVKSPKRVFSAQ